MSQQTPYIIHDPLSKIPPPNYAPPGFAPPSSPPLGFAPQGYAPPGYAPQGYAPQNYPPQPNAPQNYQPQPNAPINSVNTTNINLSPPPTQGYIVTTERRPIVVGPKSQHVTCPQCNMTSKTRTTSTSTSKTHMWALCMCCCLCWPCAWLPYCMDSCQIKNHYCGNCGAFVGSYNP